MSDRYCRWTGRLCFQENILWPADWQWRLDGWFCKLFRTWSTTKSVLIRFTKNRTLRPLVFDYRLAHKRFVHCVRHHDAVMPGWLYRTERSGRSTEAKRRPVRMVSRTTILNVHSRHEEIDAIRIPRRWRSVGKTRVALLKKEEVMVFYWKLVDLDPLWEEAQYELLVDKIDR